MNKIIYEREEDRVLIASDYSMDESIVFEFERFGINKIFSLSKVFITNRRYEIVGSDLINDNQIISPITDWLSPYWIEAKIDVDDPNKENKFRGGTQETREYRGEPTAEFQSLNVFVDDAPIFDDLDNVAANESIKLVTTNLVEASNTHYYRPRKIVEEKVTYTIRNTKIDVKVEFQVKEDARVIQYNGLQTNGQYYDRVMIPNSQIEGIQPIGEEHASGNYKKYGLTNSVLLSKDGTKDWLKVTLDACSEKSLGEGTDLILVSAAPNSKTYFRLLYDTAFNMDAGEIYWLKGSYNFVSTNSY